MILVASWTLIILGFHTQQINHRSITLKSLWARGFGKTTADLIVQWDQPKKVRSLPSSTYSSVIAAEQIWGSGSLGYIRQCDDGKHFSGACLSCIRCLQWSRVMYAGSRWVVRICSRSKDSASLVSSRDTALELYLINASFLRNTHDDYFLGHTLAYFSKHFRCSDKQIRLWRRAWAWMDSFRI